MSPKGCWMGLGLVLMAASAYIAWWANFQMESKDKGAEFLVGWAGACTFIPLALICFAIAYLARTKPPAKPNEGAERPAEGHDFRWSSGDDEHPYKQKPD